MSSPPALASKTAQGPPSTVPRVLRQGSSAGGRVVVNLAVAVKSHLDTFMDGPLKATELRMHKLFNGVEAPTLDAFLGCLRRQAFAADEVIIREGETGDRLYLIESGRCQVFKQVYTHDAIGAQCLATLEPGETFGEMEMLDHQPRSATVRGLVAGTLLTLAEGDLLKQSHGDYRTYARLVTNIAREVSIRLRQTDRWLAGSLFSSCTPPPGGVDCPQA